MTRQKRDVVPNSFMTDLAGGKVTQLTHNIDPAPWVSDLKVQRFQVTRVDGFKFWVKVTTPAKATGKLPAIFWIYPREYTDQAAYNAARVYARLGDTEQALTWLTRALDLGYDKIDYLSLDPSLVNLKKDPRFLKLLEERRPAR